MKRMIKSKTAMALLLTAALVMLTLTALFLPFQANTARAVNRSLESAPTEKDIVLSSTPDMLSELDLAPGEWATGTVYMMPVPNSGEDPGIGLQYFVGGENIPAAAISTGAYRQWKTFDEGPGAEPVELTYSGTLFISLRYFKAGGSDFLPYEFSEWSAPISLNIDAENLYVDWELAGSTIVFSPTESDSFPVAYSYSVDGGEFKPAPAPSTTGTHAGKIVINAGFAVYPTFRTVNIRALNTVTGRFEDTDDYDPITYQDADTSATFTVLRSEVWNEATTWPDGKPHKPSLVGNLPVNGIPNNNNAANSGTPTIFTHNGWVNGDVRFTLTPSGSGTGTFWYRIGTSGAWREINEYDGPFTHVVDDTTVLGTGLGDNYYFQYVEDGLNPRQMGSYNVKICKDPAPTFTMNNNNGVTLPNIVSGGTTYSLAGYIFLFNITSIPRSGIKGIAFATNGSQQFGQITNGNALKAALPTAANFTVLVGNFRGQGSTPLQMRFCVLDNRDTRTMATPGASGTITATPNVAGFTNASTRAAFESLPQQAGFGIVGSNNAGGAVITPTVAGVTTPFLASGWPGSYISNSNATTGLGFRSGSYDITLTSTIGTMNNATLQYSTDGANWVTRNTTDWPTNANVFRPPGNGVYYFRAGISQGGDVSVYGGPIIINNIDTQEPRVTGLRIQNAAGAWNAYDDEWVMPGTELTLVRSAGPSGVGETRVKGPDGSELSIYNQYFEATQNGPHTFTARSGAGVWATGGNIYTRTINVDDAKFISKPSVTDVGGDFKILAQAYSDSAGSKATAVPLNYYYSVDDGANWTLIEQAVLPGTDCVFNVNRSFSADYVFKAESVLGLASSAQSDTYPYAKPNENGDMSVAQIMGSFADFSFTASGFGDLADDTSKTWIVSPDPPVTPQNMVAQFVVSSDYYYDLGGNAPGAYKVYYQVKTGSGSWSAEYPMLPDADEMSWYCWIQATNVIVEVCFILVYDETDYINGGKTDGIGCVMGYDTVEQDQTVATIEGRFFGSGTGSLGMNDQTWYSAGSIELTRTNEDGGSGTAYQYRLPGGAWQNVTGGLERNILYIGGESGAISSYGGDIEFRATRALGWDVGATGNTYPNAIWSDIIRVLCRVDDTATAWYNQTQLSPHYENWAGGDLTVTHWIEGPKQLTLQFTHGGSGFEEIYYLVEGNPNPQYIVSGGNVVAAPSLFTPTDTSGLSPTAQNNNLFGTFYVPQNGKYTFYVGNRVGKLFVTETPADIRFIDKTVPSFILSSNWMLQPNSPQGYQNTDVFFTLIPNAMGTSNGFPPAGANYQYRITNSSDGTTSGIYDTGGWVTLTSAEWINDSSYQIRILEDIANNAKYFEGTLEFRAVSLTDVVAPNGGGTLIQFVNDNNGFKYPVFIKIDDAAISFTAEATVMVPTPDPVPIKLSSDAAMPVYYFGGHHGFADAASGFLWMNETEIPEEYYEPGSAKEFATEWGTFWFVPLAYFLTENPEFVDSSTGYFAAGVNNSYYYFVVAEKDDPGLFAARRVSINNYQPAEPELTVTSDYITNIVKLPGDKTYPTGWNSGDVKFTLVANNDSWYYYTTDPEMALLSGTSGWTKWAEAGGEFTAPMTGDTDNTYPYYTYYFKAVSLKGDGVDSLVTMVTFKIDSTPPTLTVECDIKGAPGYYQSGSLAINAAVGVSGGTLEFDNDGTWEWVADLDEGGDTFADVLPITANGTYRYRLTNGAGVVTNATVTITNIDRLPVGFTLDRSLDGEQYDGSLAGWLSGDFSFTIVPNDAPGSANYPKSGITYYYAYDDAVGSETWIPIYFVDFSGKVYYISKAVLNSNQADDMTWYNVYYVDGGKVYWLPENGPAEEVADPAADTEWQAFLDAFLGEIDKDTGLPVPLTLKAKDDDHPYRFRAESGSQGVTPIAATGARVRVRIDNTAPTFTVDFVTGTASMTGYDTWASDDVKFTFDNTNSDLINATNLVRYEWKNGASGAWSSGNVDGDVFTAQANGVYYFRAVTAAGVYSEEPDLGPYYVRIDRSTPYISVVQSPTAWTNGDVTFTLTGGATSGVKEFQVRKWNGTAWGDWTEITDADFGVGAFNSTAGTGSFTVEASGVAEGDFEISHYQFRVYSNAKSYSVWDDEAEPDPETPKGDFYTAKIDKVKLVIAVTSVPEAHDYTGGEYYVSDTDYVEFTLGLKAGESVPPSGVYGYQYVRDPVGSDSGKWNWINVGDASSAEILAGQSGKYYFRVMSNAGKPSDYQIWNVTINRDIVIFITAIGTAPASQPVGNVTYGSLPSNGSATATPGYTFMGWSYTNTSGIWTTADETLTESSPLATSGTHTLTALWRMNQVSVTADNETHTSVAENNVTHTYDRTAVPITATPSFVTSDPDSPNYVYQWEKGTVDSTPSAWAEATNRDRRFGENQSFTNVSDSGLWKLTLTVTGALGITSEAVTYVRVTIAPREMDLILDEEYDEDLTDAGKANFDLGTVAWDGTVKAPLIYIQCGGYTLVEDVDYKITKKPATDVRNAGKYGYEFTFRDNYDGFVVGVFTIEMRVQVSFANLKPSLSPVAADISTVIDVLTDDSGDVNRYYVMLRGDGTYQNLPGKTDMEAGVKGYTFKGWSFGGDTTNLITNGLDHKTPFSHTLYAVWELKAPAVTIAGDGYATGKLEFTYDRQAHIITASATLDGMSEGMYTYTWYKVGAPDTLLGFGAEQSFTNVSQNGAYYVIVTVADNVVAPASSEKINFTVNILQKSLGTPFGDGEDFENGEGITVEIAPGIYTGFAVEPTVIVRHNGVALLTTEYYFSPSNATTSEDHLIIIYPSSSNSNYTGNAYGTFTIVDNSSIILYTPISTVFKGSVQAVAGMYPELPDPEPYPGYQFLRWEYNGKTAKEGEDLLAPGSHMLTAIWEINQIVVTNLAALEVDTVYTRAPHSRTVAYGFTPSAPAAGVAYTYDWVKGTDTGGSWIPDEDAMTKSGSFVSFTNVNESGVWKLTVTATGAGYSTMAVEYVSVSITEKSLATTDTASPGPVTIVIPARDIGPTYSLTDIKDSMTVSFNGAPLVEGTDYTLYEITGGLYNVARSYTFRFTAVAGSNYKDFRDVDFVISSNATVTFVTLVGTAPAPILLTGNGYYYASGVGTAPPAITATGYDFDCWEYNGTPIASDGELPKVSGAYVGSHVLTAKWKLKDPSVTVDGIDEAYNWSPHTTEAFANVDGMTENDNMIFTYEWSKGGDVRASKLLNVTNVSDSGDWTLTVTARDPFYGLESSKTFTDVVNVKITPVDLVDVTILLPSSPYNGTAVLAPSYWITYMGRPLTIGTDYSLDEVDRPGGGYLNTGSYDFVFSGIAGGNFVGEKTVVFEIFNNITIYYYSELPGLRNPGTSYGDDAEWFMPAAGDKYPVLPSKEFMEGLATDAGYNGGYEFVGWRTSLGASVAAGGAITSTAGISVALTAVWKLLAPTVDLNAGKNAAEDNRYEIGGEYEIGRWYDVTAEGAHPDAMSFTYVWAADGGQIGSNFESSGAYMRVSNIAGSGWYKVTVTAHGQLGLSASVTERVYVTITPRSASALTITVPSVYFDDTPKLPDIRIYDEAYRLVYGTDYTTDRGDTWRATNAGTYPIEITFINNYSNNGVVYKPDFVIVGATVTLVGLPQNSAYQFTTEFGVLTQTPDGKYQNLPDADTMNALEGAAGYTFVRWEYVGYEATVPVANTETLPYFGNHQVRAVWNLKTPYANAPIVNVVDRGYNHTQTTTLSVPYTHDAVGILYTYSWGYNAAEANNYVAIPGAVGATYGVKDVSQSGFYRLTVTAWDGGAVGLGRSASANFYIKVNIDAKQMTASNISVTHVNYNGNSQPPYFTVTDDVSGNIYTLTQSDFDITYIYPDYVTNGIFNYAGEYKLVFVFKNNYTQAGANVTVSYFIRPTVLTFVEASLKGVTNPGNYDATYDGKYPTLPNLGTKSGDDYYIAGYRFIGWSTTPDGKNIVEAGNGLSQVTTHGLYAVWELLPPTFAAVTAETQYIRTYDFTDETVLSVTTAHELTSGLTYYYKWERSAPDSGARSLLESTGNSHSVKDVKDSGWYYVTVYVRDAEGLISEELTHIFKVAISQKLMAAGNVTIGEPMFTGVEYSAATIGSFVTVTDRVNGEVYTLLLNTDYTIDHLENTYFAADEYTIRLNFTGNYSGSFVVSFNIKPIAITLYTDRGELLTGSVYSYDGLYPALPTIADIPGFRFIGWKYNNVPVAEGSGLSIYGVHQLVAVWQLTDPVVGGTAKVERGYNRLVSTTLTPTVTHAYVGVGTVTYSYAWYFSSTDADGYGLIIGESASFTGIVNVSQSGWYKVVVTAHMAGENSSNGVAYEFQVIIHPKEITEGDFDIQSKGYSGEGQQPNIQILDGTYTLSLGTDYLMSPPNVTEYTLMGDYPIEFTFINNYVGDVTKIFMIRTARVTFENVKGMLPDDYFVEVTEDGYYQNLPVLEGVTGYTFVGWQYQFPASDATAIVDNGERIRSFDHHVLTAVWKLGGEFGSGIGSAMISGVPEGLELERGYQYGIVNSLMFLKNPLLTDPSYTFTYQYARWNGSMWEDIEGAVTNGYSVTDVADSGLYRLSVTVDDGERVIELSYVFDVKITPQVLSIKNIEVMVGGDALQMTYVGSGHLYYPVIVVRDNFGRVLVKETEFTYEGVEADGMGTYPINVTILSDNYVADPKCPCYVDEKTIQAELLISDEVIIVFLGYKDAVLEKPYLSITMEDGKYYYPELPTPGNGMDMTLVPSSYEFQYWSTTPDGANRIDGGEEIVPPVSGVLYAIWVFNPGGLTDPDDGIGSVFITGVAEGFTLDRGYRLGVTNALTFERNPGFSITAQFSYAWAKWDDGEYKPIAGASSNTLSVTNARDSGLYRLYVTVSDDDMAPVVVEYDFTVTIIPQLLTADDIFVPMRNDIVLPPTVFVTDRYKVLLSEGADYTMVVNGGLEIKTSGTYPVEITFTDGGNYYVTTEGNYYVVVDYVINADIIYFVSYMTATISEKFINITGMTVYPELPMLTELPFGYTFLGWSTTGDATDVVEAGGTIGLVRTLIGVWKFNDNGPDGDPPGIGEYPTGSGEYPGLGIAQIDSSGIRTLDRDYSFGVTNVLRFDRNPMFSSASAEFSYEFTKGGATVGTSNTLSVTNVKDSGTYVLTVTVTDGDMEPFVVTYEFEISILPQELTAAQNISVPGQTTGYPDPNYPVVTVADNGGRELSQGTEYTFVSYGGSVIPGAGDYPVVITLDSDGNYIVIGPGTVSQYEIAVTFTVSSEAFLSFTGYKTAILMIAAPIEITGFTQYPELPTPDNNGLVNIPFGYVFLGWSTDGTKAGIVIGGTAIADPAVSHTLTAVWEFKNEEGDEEGLGEYPAGSGEYPGLGVALIAGAKSDDGMLSRAAVPALTINRTYRFGMSNQLMFVRSPSFNSVTAEFTFAWEWDNYDGGGYRPQGTSDTLSVTNTWDSGSYMLYVTVSDGSMEPYTVIYYFDVTINAQILTADNVYVPASFSLDEPITPERIWVTDHDGRLLTAGNEFEVVLNGGTPIPGAGTYLVEITFTSGGNYFATSVGNYVLTVDFTVTDGPPPITHILTFAGYRGAALGFGGTELTNYWIDITGTAAYPALPVVVADKPFGLKLVGWSTTADGKNVVQAGDPIDPKASRTLYAVWELDPDDIGDPSGLAGFTLEKSADVSREYALGVSDALSLNFTYILPEVNITYTYDWFKNGVSIPRPPLSNGVNSITVTDVTHSGFYTVYVTATDPEGATAVFDIFSFTVNIWRQDILEENITITPGNWNFGNAVPMTIQVTGKGDEILVLNADYTVERQGSPNNGYMGEQTVTIIGINNYVGILAVAVEVPRIQITLNNMGRGDLTTNPVFATDNGEYPTLPTAPGFNEPGYEFGGWWYGNEQVFAANSLKSADLNQSLTAKWTLLKPGIDQTINGAAKSAGSGVYDRSKTYDLKGEASHLADVSYSYAWTYSKTGTAGSYNTPLASSADTYSGIQNVSESGYYKLTVTIRHTLGGIEMTQSEEAVFYIAITPKPIAKNQISVNQAAWTGDLQGPTFTIMDGAYRLNSDRLDYAAIPSKNYTDMGIYMVLITFPEGGNYMAGTGSGWYTDTIVEGEYEFTPAEAGTGTFGILMEYEIPLIKITFNLNGRGVDTIGEFMYSTKDGRYQDFFEAGFVPWQDGYVFMGWRFGGLDGTNVYVWDFGSGVYKFVGDDQADLRLGRDHVLYAWWELSTLDIRQSVTTRDGSNIAPAFIPILPAEDVLPVADTIVDTFSKDKVHLLEVFPPNSQALTFTYSYTWQKLEPGSGLWVAVDGARIFTSTAAGEETTDAGYSSYWVKDVADSGTYRVVIYVTDKVSGSGDIHHPPVTLTFTVSITPILADDLTIWRDTPLSFTGNPHVLDTTVTVKATGVVLERGVDYDVTVNPGTLRNMGTYTVTYIFNDNYYSATPVTRELVITPIMVTLANHKGAALGTYGVSSTSYLTAAGVFQNLPTLTGVSGYTFVGWEYADKVAVANTNPIVVAFAPDDAVTLYAVWTLNAPTVTVSEVVAGALTPSGDTFTFSGGYKGSAYVFTAAGSVGGLSADKFTYTW
ncbi:MAG: InlB B-repeat-containing protein, partial [Firmicutes bacterium]|nr:InlB B-repeat-containing protein [Bacillota bacterium]